MCLRMAEGVKEGKRPGSGEHSAARSFLPSVYVQGAGISPNSAGLHVHGMPFSGGPGLELAGPKGAGATLPVSSRGSGGAHAKVVRAPGLVLEEDATQGPRTSPEIGVWQGGTAGPGAGGREASPASRCLHHVPRVHTLSLSCLLPEDAWSFLKCLV